MSKDTTEWTLGVDWAGTVFIIAAPAEFAWLLEQTGGCAEECGIPDLTRTSKHHGPGAYFVTLKHWSSTDHETGICDDFGFKFVSSNTLFQPEPAI